MVPATKQRPNINPRFLILFAAMLALSALAGADLAAQTKNDQGKPGEPKIVFNPKRPIPEPPGDVRDIESLIKPPPGYTMSKRNNFYKKQNGKTVPGTDLYRWANSGHWSNYDEAEVGNYKLPDPLLTLGGKRVTSADMWFKERRPEILKMVETDFYGRVPDNAPKVVWEVTSNLNDGTTIKKTIVGKLVGADGKSPPAGAAKGGKGFGGGGGNTIVITLTLPAGKGKVPVFFGGLSQQECLSMGWGYGSISSPTGTLISMTAPPKGQPRPGDFWANYRIVAWCFSRAIDYLETDPDVDARYICISGHSTGGKQVLCTAALEPRIFMVVPTSSGKMGAAIIRRDYGETLDDQAQLYAQNYCANVKKWVGRWDDMPFDSHFFIALVAPRLCFITAGSGELWVDGKGCFEACVAADPVYRILDKKGFGATAMPKADMPVINGELAFYYHTGGHTFTPAEHKAVMAWGSKYMQSDKAGGAIKVDLKKFTFKAKEGVSALNTHNDNDDKLCFYTNGQAEATVKIPADGKYEIFVKASCNSALDERAKFKLTFDGKLVDKETLLTDDDEKEYKLTTEAKMGERKLVIEFTNDVYKEGEYDRNLYVHGVTLKSVK